MYNWLPIGAKILLRHGMQSVKKRKEARYMRRFLIVAIVVKKPQRSATFALNRSACNLIDIFLFCRVCKQTARNRSTCEKKN